MATAHLFVDCAASWGCREGETSHGGNMQSHCECGDRARYRCRGQEAHVEGRCRASSPARKCWDCSCNLCTRSGSLPRQEVYLESSCSIGEDARHQWEPGSVITARNKVLPTSKISTRYCNGSLVFAEPAKLKAFQKTLCIWSCLLN